MTTVDPVPPTAPATYFGSTFSRWVTLVLSVLLALIFTFLFVPRTPEERVRDFERPVRSAVRFFERDLEVHDALDAMPSWMRRLGEIVFETSSETMSSAILGYREVLTLGPTRPDEDAAKVSDKQREREAELVELRARLVILLEESGRVDDAREELALLKHAGQASLAEALRAAYGDRPAETPRAIDSFDLELLGPGWAKDHLLAQLAERTGDAALASTLHAEAARRVDHWWKRLSFLMFLFLAPCLAGLAAFLWWLWRDRPPVLAASAHIPPLWCWDDGCAVLVRSAFAGIAASSAVVFTSQALGVKAFTLWIELLASLPMLWWMRRALLAPHGLDFCTAFGLWPKARGAIANTLSASSTSVESASAELASGPTLGRKLFSWTAFALALIALDQLGAAVISIGCRNFGVEPHWSEAVQESLMWTSNSQALLGSLDGFLWAPIFEEIGCRGLLYLTLRTRSGPQTAALFSASMFAAVHVYSLPGFLSVAWSGYLWAIAFERCRSLAPGMICHAFWNGFLIAGNFMFYR